MKRILPISATIAILSLFVAAQTPKADSKDSGKPEINKVAAPHTSPADGKGMYTAYCASCHGASGKGDGPAAPALKVPATDLTKLTNLTPALRSRQIHAVVPLRVTARYVTFHDPRPPAVVSKTIRRFEAAQRHTGAVCLVLAKPAARPPDDPGGRPLPRHPAGADPAAAAVRTPVRRSAGRW